MRTTTNAAASLTLLAVPVLAGTGGQPVEWHASDGTDFNVFGGAIDVDGTTAIVSASTDDQNGEDAGAAYLFDTATNSEIAKLVASDGAAKDRFGASVAICGPVAVVGSYQDDDNGTESGSAYVFNAVTGAEVMKLTPSDGEAWDRFGVSVAVGGNTIAVGAYADDDNGLDAGAVYLFDATTGAELHKLLAGDGGDLDYFGRSLAMEGNTVVVGASSQNNYTGAFYVFDAATGLEQRKVLAPDGEIHDWFGFSLSISGPLVLAGAHGDDDGGNWTGSAYVFDLNTGAMLAKLNASDAEDYDNFGFDVALSGWTALVGAYANDNGSEPDVGSAYIFDVTTGAELTKLLPSEVEAHDWFGAAVAYEGVAFVGSPGDDDDGLDAGTVYAFPAGLESYCTAGVSASGCQALLSVTGTASASAGSGFLLFASNVEGARDGLFFFGTNGRQANPWGNGTSLQCVVSPVKRGGLLSGTGSFGACDGAFAQDLNARWAAVPKQNPGSGALVQTQLWYRDPWSSSNQTTSLSDAIEFPVCP